MSRSVVDISEVGNVIDNMLKKLSIEGKRIIANEMGNMATYKFPQAVMRFYPTVLRVRTGRLRQSFEGFSERTSDTSWRVGMHSRNVEYATIQHEGGQTAPHVIEPRNKKALFWEGASHPVRRVNHPGSNIKAKKYFEEPMKREIDPMIKRIKDKIKLR